MAEITTTQAFSDGDTVTATKLNNITANAAVQTEAITNRSAETTVDQANDLLLMYDASATALKKISLSNVIKAGTASNFPVTGNATVGGTLAVTGAITASSTVNGTTIPTSKTLVTTNDTQTLTNKTLTSPAINTGTISGGTINNAVIGGTTAAAGSFTTLSATSPITTQAGTAASPAIAPTGDTNTGAFFPAADTVGISTGGVERVQVDSNGNVGIGQNPLSSDTRLTVSGGYTTLGLYNSGTTGSSPANTTGVSFSNNITNGQAEVDIWNSSDPSVYTNTGILFTQRLTSTTRRDLMFLHNNGNVGIGTTTPSAKLTVSGSGARFGIINTGASANNKNWDFETTSTSLVLRGLNDSGAAGGNTFVFTRSAEQINNFIGTNSGNDWFVIDNSSARVGIGTTSPSYRLSVVDNSIATRINVINSNNATAGAGAYFQVTSSGTTVSDCTIAANNAGALLFSTGTSSGAERLRITSEGEVYIAGTTDQGAYNLQVNGTGVWGAGAYVNGSDERLKENIQDITSGLDVVEKLRPVSFQYKEEYTADRSIQSGFIAQDLLVALEGKNYLEGVVSQGPTYYNVAYQNLIPILAKAIQELKAENESLKTRIAALEAA